MSEWLDGLVQVTVGQYAFSIVMAFVGGYFAARGSRDRE